MQRSVMVSLLIALFVGVTLSAPVLAQRNPGRQPGQPVGPQPRPGPQGPDQQAAQTAAGACACGFVAIWFLIVGLILAVHVGVIIFLAIWVHRDATARRVENPTIWVVLMIFATWIGLIIYLVTRPPGSLYVCPECGKKRLEGSKRCPHCGST